MKRISSFSKMTALMFVAVGLLFTACEPYQFQALKGTVTTEAKNAIDVLPADVMYVAMMNTQDLDNNEFTDVLGPQGAIYGNSSQEGVAMLMSFLEVTNLDPEEDLQSIYLAVSESDRSQPDFSAVVYVENDPESLENYLENYATGTKQMRNYKGINIFESTDGDAPSVGLANEEMVLFGSSSVLIEAMIDRLQGEASVTPALSSDDDMMALVEDAAIGGSGWFIGKKPADANLGFNNNMTDSMARDAMQIWSALDYAVGTLNIEGDGFDSQVLFYPSENVSTDDMASLMNGLIAAAKAFPEIEAQQLEVLDDLRAKASGDYVRIAMYIDNNMIQTVSGR
ncbi:MAG: DUF3352 domain-containing protein [Bacteroidota bacterium]